jgi:NNP family nitrate/nitrite transporter-like MFS transporter
MKVEESQGPHNGPNMEGIQGTRSDPISLSEGDAPADMEGIQGARNDPMSSSQVDATASDIERAQGAGSDPLSLPEVTSGVAHRRRRSSARELAAQYFEAELSINLNPVMEPVVAPFVDAEPVLVASPESPSKNDSAASESPREDKFNEDSVISELDDFSMVKVKGRNRYADSINEDSVISELDDASGDKVKRRNRYADSINENSVISDLDDLSRDKVKSKYRYTDSATEHLEECKNESPRHDVMEEINEDVEHFSNIAAPDSKYTLYHVAVNPRQEDRAADIPLYDCARPHMRAFHLAWLSFFVAFFTWFAMTPLLGEIARSLDLSREEIWTSSVLAVSSSAFTRIVMGPLNDRYGARWVMAGTLVAAAIPTGMAGLVNSVGGLYAVRLLIGVAGSAFVTCQYWTSCMFMMEIAGTANALAAGWGNMGGGVAQVVMGSLLFPLFKVIFGGEGYNRIRVQGKDDDADRPEYDRASDMAWRVILVFPAVLSLIMAWAVVRHADDTPKGNTSKRLREPSIAVTSLRSGVFDLNTWLLAFQYGCCFGVEITMIQAAALYFQEEFGQPTEAAAAIASIFGWMNLFARGIGGFSSDMANAQSGLRGRLICQVIFLCAEGGLVIVFSYTQTLGGAIFVMMMFSIFVQAAEGSTYGIVPYINPLITGSISGLVAAGGNFGGVAFALLFRGLNDDRTAFLWMGCTALGSAFLTVLIHIRGHRNLLSGKDSFSVENRVTSDLPYIISFASPPVNENADRADAGITETEEPQEPLTETEEPQQPL